jgi:hypothetical protein
MLDVVWRQRIVSRCRVGDIGLERQISEGHPLAFQVWQDRR